MSEETQLSTLGNLEPKIANMLCYLPIMSVNLIASIAFLATEDKENHRVRFHAAQGLLVIAGIMGAGVAYFVVSLVLAIGAGVIDGILGTSFLSMIAGLVNLLLLLALAAGLFIVPFGATAMAFMEKRLRIPILAGLAERFLGHGDGWTE